MSYEAIAVLMFSTFMLLLLTGQRVFGAIGFVAAVFALALWGEGAIEMPFASTITLINWYPMLTLPMFVYMGYMLSESGIASDLYRMFHVWTGPMRGGLAVGTILLMVAISAMNGLSVAGMAIGATIALPELLKRGYDKIMVTGVIQAGSSLGIMIPPSVVLVLYGMIARQPVGQLWLAGVGPGLLLAALFILYILIRCHLQPHLGPPLPLEERQQITWGEKILLLQAGVLPLFIIFSMTGLFVMGVTSMVESSAVGAFAATLVAAYKGRITRKVLEDTLRKSLAVSAMFMWIILAALLSARSSTWSGQGDRSPVPREVGPGALAGAGADATHLHPDGHLPRRHRDADHRGAALRAARDRARVQSHLVRHPLHDHLPDRLHHAAVRVQPVPDAGDGTEGSHADRHLQVDRPVRVHHARGARARDHFP
jgi:tripartite ATP-independent transporter DctM subunit